MPCFDSSLGPSSQQEYEKAKADLWKYRMSEAGLCAAMRYMQVNDIADDFLAWVDTDMESGLCSQNFKDWWKDHCKKDRIRKGFEK